MTDALEMKIVLILRPTRLDELVARFNTVQQAQFYVEHLGADFAEYLAEHAAYRNAAQSTEATLAEFGRVQVLQRRHVPNYLFGPKDCIVVVGQDGLVANVLKYLDGQRVIGVNPDPRRCEGILLPFTVADLPRVMPEELAAKRPVRQVRMARARLNTGLELYAVNDLFIGQRAHMSARYGISLAQRSEQHSSSGIIVATGLGSTGWMRSVHAGWAATARALLGHDVPVGDGAFAWDADYLRFAVREPWPSRTTQAGLVFGAIQESERLDIVSMMPEGGVIFSDGIEADFLEFNSGTRASITLAERRGLLVA